VWLEKDDGGQRPIGKPTFEDKIVQRAVAMLLEAIYEQDFQDSSYGFRRGRSPHEALHERRERCMTEGIGWIVDAEVSGYFDSIDKTWLRDMLRTRVNDGSVLRLIGKWLHAGVMEEGVLTHPETGVPQGGVISPLLSNIYLNALDATWEHRYAHLGSLVRYADDFVVMCDTKAACEEAEQRVRAILTRLGLELHPDKTRQVDLSRGRQGVDFLGCHLHKRMSGAIWEKERNRVYFLQRWPSQRSMQRARQRVKELTGRNRNGVKDARVLVRDLNPILRGWGNYFRTGNAARQFVKLDRYVVDRLHGFMVKRKGRNLRPGEASGWTRDHFERLGLWRLRGTIQYPGLSRMPRPETSSVSRVREIRTHGLKGGPTLHRAVYGVT